MEPHEGLHGSKEDKARHTVLQYYCTCKHFGGLNEDVLRELGDSR